MCLAVPRRVLCVDGDRVEVEWDGEPLWVSAVAVTDLEPGEYVLVHAGLVLDRVSAEEAEQILALQATLMAEVGDILWADVEVEAGR
jgi:hydrogenase expression/formation protein HypC